jgi:hypothetical protein
LDWGGGVGGKVKGEEIINYLRERRRKLGGLLFGIG